MRYARAFNPRHRVTSLADSRLPAIDQNTAIFYERYVIDESFGGLAFEDEGMRCAGMLQDQKVSYDYGKSWRFGLGQDVADTFNRLYYFERAAETYIRALQTGQPLRELPHDIAAKTAAELDDYQIKRKVIFLNSKQSWMKR